MPQPSRALLSPPPSRRTRRRPDAPALLLVLTLALTACASPGTSTPPTSSPAASTSLPTSVPTVSSSPTTSEAPTSSTSPGPSLPTQTATAWGRIWDALPPSFPVYPGAQTAPTNGPVSASLTSTADVATLTSWVVPALTRAGFQATAGPPLDDGSRVVDSTGSPAGCKAQVQLRPEGSLTNILVLYGADCPFR